MLLSTKFYSNEAQSVSIRIASARSTQSLDICRLTSPFAMKKLARYEDIARRDFRYSEIAEVNYTVEDRR